MIKIVHVCAVNRVNGGHSYVVFDIDKDGKPYSHGVAGLEYLARHSANQGCAVRFLKPYDTGCDEFGGAGHTLYDLSDDEKIAFNKVYFATLATNPTLKRA